MAKKQEESYPSYSELAKKLKTDGPGRLYLLWGEEDYLVSAFAAEVEKLCVTESSADFDKKQIEGPVPDLNELEDALRAMPFFGERTYVEVSKVEMTRCTDARYQEILGDIPEWCTVVITLAPDTAPNFTLKLSKMLRDKYTAHCFHPQEGAELYNWIRRRFQAQGKRIERPEIEHLVFISGNLMTRLVQEINKICAYSSGDIIRKEDIDAVAHHLPEADVFEMTELLSSGNVDKAAALFADLLASDSDPGAPIKILAAMAGQYRGLYAVSLANKKGLGPDFIKKATGKPDFVVKKLQKVAKAYRLKDLRRAVLLMAQTDYRMKGGDAAAGEDPREALGDLFLRLALMTHA